MRNRIAVSPMCQYSATNGHADEWHLVHLGSRAVGGAGLVMTEAAAVSPEGRISPGDLGMWDADHMIALARIAYFCREQGSVPAIQLAHAGRKASMTPPWVRPAKNLSEDEGGWDNVVAPSAEQFSPTYPVPHAMDAAAMRKVLDDFVASAKLSHEAGFLVAELHGAHGYLMHEFLSPLSNHRTDAYGGSFENRVRFPMELVHAVRNAWPERLPLWVRISAVDWVEGGWTIEDSVRFAKLLKEAGVDLVDVSSGGNDPRQKIPLGPGYQVPFAEQVRREARIATGAVGLITDARQADAIVREGQADVVLLAREMLRDPYWPIHAADALGIAASWPVQYERAALGAVERREELSFADDERPQDPGETLGGLDSFRPGRNEA